MNARNPLSKVISAVVLAGAVLLAISAPGYGRPQEIDIDTLLRNTASFDGGIDSKAYWTLFEYVMARQNDPAARAACEVRLDTFLSSKATPFAKQAVCRMLKVVGSEKSIPALKPLLLDAATSDMALYALSALPAPAADRALLETLALTSGTTRASLLSVLGRRKTLEALPAIARQLSSDHAPTQSAAAAALAEIGNKQAVEALLAALPQSSAAARENIAAALIVCAERALAAKNNTAALRLYDAVAAVKPAETIAAAAFRGRIAASGDRGRILILENFMNPAAPHRETAIGMIRTVFAQTSVGPVVEVLRNLPPGDKVKVLAVLAHYPKDIVLPAVLRSAGDESAEVRIAAFKTLAIVGDASCVDLTAQSAAKARGAEQDAARGALASLRGRDVDEAVLVKLGQTHSEEIAAELLQAVSERRLFEAKNAVASFLGSASARLRLQAVKTIRVVGTPSDIPAVLDLLLRSADDSERQEAETTAGALARKIAEPDGRANSVKNRLAGEKDPGVRARLFSVLNRIGDDSALSLLRAGLDDPNDEVVDAAARAVAGWPTSTPIEDVWKIAKTSSNETHKLLALQGFIRMTAAAKYRRADAVVADLKLAAEISRRPEEKRLVLAALPDFPCTEALDLAQMLAGDETVKAEADAAVKKIKELLAKK